MNVIVAQGLSEDSVAEQTLRIIEKLNHFEEPLKLQIENITEPGELRLTNHLQKAFEAFRLYIVAREQPFYWKESTSISRRLEKIFWRFTK